MPSTLLNITSCISDKARMGVIYVACIQAAEGFVATVTSIELQLRPSDQ